MNQMLYFDQVAWIEYLPNDGGEWGKGITGLVSTVQSNVARMEAERAKLTQQISLQTKLLKATVKRAETECTMLFADAQIAEAKAKRTTGVLAE